MRVRKHLNQLFVTIVAVAALLPAIASAEDVVTYDLSDFSNMSGRTQEDVEEKYLDALKTGDTYINGSRDSYYTTAASTSSPYAAGVLSEDTLENMEAMSNFYRWLIGVEDLTVNSASNASLQAQALDRNFEFNHYISQSSKPDDMDQELWDEGYYCSHNILARGYTPAGAITGWLNEGYYLSASEWDTLGHRSAILNPYYSSITYGYSGTVAIGTCGAANNTFTNAFAAFPSGYFPSNLIYKSSSAWDCRLNTSQVKVSDTSAVVVTVTDLTTGSSYECTSDNGYASLSSSYIAFRQPSATTSYYEDQYRVDITGLTDVATGGAACVTYTVNFFSIDNQLYSSSLSLERNLYAYTGSAIEPAFTVSYSGTVLTEGTDYEVSYIDNTDIGTGIVCVTGKGDYFGVSKKAFTIREDKKILDECTITVASCSYTGSPLKPAVTVTNYGDTLVEGTDYTLTYSNNTNPGTGTVLVKGKGKYSGSQTVTFTINKGSQTVSATRDLSTIEVGGTAKITASGIGDITYSVSNSDVLSVDTDGTVHALEAGSTYVYVKAAGNDYYASATKYLYFTVSADIHTMVDTAVTYANGSSNTAKVTRKCAVCGETETSSFTTMTSFNLWWWTGYLGSSGYSDSQTEGTQMDVTLRNSTPSDAENKDLEVISSDESIAKVDGYGWTFVGTGTVTITVRAKYNPSVKQTATFTVSHSYDEGTVTKVPTCTASGVRTYTCSICGENKTETIAALGHTSVTDPAVAATYTTTGLTQGAHCSVCGTVLMAQKTVEKLTPDKVTVASASNTTSGVKISWNEVADADGYRIYRKIGSGSYTYYKTIASSATTAFTDTKVTSGTTYTYAVRAYVGNVYGTYSGKTIKYLAPTTLSGLVNYSAGIQVQWTKVTGASGYYVYRKAGNATTWSRVAIITSGTTLKWNDTNTSNSVKYQYCVKAYSGSYASAYKGVVTYRIATPVISSVTNSAAGSVTVKWNKNTTATGYQIYYVTGTTSKTVTVSGNTNISKVISGLNKGNTYTIKVRAYKKVGTTYYYSGWSAGKTIKITK